MMSTRSRRHDDDVHPATAASRRLTCTRIIYIYDCASHGVVVLVMDYACMHMMSWCDDVFDTSLELGDRAGHESLRFACGVTRDSNTRCVTFETNMTQKSIM